MSTTTTGSAAGFRPQLQLAQLPNNVDQLHLDDDEVDQDTWSSSSQSSSAPPTPTETSGASTPRALSPVVFINDQDDDQVPIVDICSGGDLVVNVRRLGVAISAREQGLSLGASNKSYTEVEPLARFRVSSVILRMASRHVKNCLDSGVGSSTPFPTGLPLLWLHKDDNQALNLLMERTMWTSGSVLAERKALATLLRILHLRLNSKYPIRTYWCDEGVMTALVAEFACALDCVGPVVPWINLWLTRYLPVTYASDWSWYCSAKGHHVGTLVSYTMGDEIAFSRWSRLCIRYGHDSDSFAGLGYMWSVIDDDLQIRRRGCVEKLLAVLDEFWNLYSADQTITAVSLAHSIALGAFARAIKHQLGHLHHPPFVNISWQQSLDDLILVFHDIKKFMNTVWEAFLAQNRSSEGVTFENPADVFWTLVETVWGRVSGLNLQDYRPGVNKLLDVDEILDSKIPKGAEYVIPSRESESGKLT